MSRDGVIVIGYFASIIALVALLIGGGWYLNNGYLFGIGIALVVFILVAMLFGD